MCCVCGLFLIDYTNIICNIYKQFDKGSSGSSLPASDLKDSSEIIPGKPLPESVFESDVFTCSCCGEKSPDSDRRCCPKCNRNICVNCADFLQENIHFCPFCCLKEFGTSS